ncbi:hypothetical protein TSOC_013458 [Tetrabaena socialis]|uniref:Uncharacterized protein n=1 Tax=Tetrabaena socialis TaxID=47790 RepID=A0A2J7ZKB3_9CHLO|nr:hypothetical protein TSOC_013458 [Tetrabaena socialis]|eukprot:PNH00703.1 hypothetical protein TSOC_013458 [Tetrabaena socialis]
MITLLPGTPHAMDLPLMQTLVVSDSPLFDYLAGNEQMRSVADYVTQYPTAQLHFKPNIVEAPEHTLAMPMTKGPESKSALAVRHVTFCSSASPSHALGGGNHVTVPAPSSDSGPGPFSASAPGPPSNSSAASAAFANSGYAPEHQKAHACKGHSWTGLLTFALTLFLLSSFSVHVGATHAQNTGINGVTLTSQLLATGGLLCSSASERGVIFFDGRTAAAAYERYQKDEDGGWVWGNSQHLSANQHASLQAIVRQRKHTAFAYSMEELPGDCGDQVPVRLDLNTDRPIVQSPRRYRPTGGLFLEGKCRSTMTAQASHCAPTIGVTAQQMEAHALVDNTPRLRATQLTRVPTAS